MNNRPLRVAIIGMGGFAGDHHRSLHTLEQQGACRLVCTCDPFPDAFREAQERWKFAERGVAVFSDYLAMLDAHQGNLDMVTVPTPIPLHAPMHRACVELGLACYLEKPPTLNHTELTEMLAVETAARHQTQVGFLYIIEAERQALKTRLLSGEFGAVRRVCFLGMAPRPTSYFTRASWAGRLLLNGRLVLDSVIGNATSHYLHNLLFWAGQESLFAWESVTSAQAELYRAHAIEGTDTVFIQGLCANGIEARVAATHASDSEHHLREWIECERATLQRTTGEPYHIVWKDGREETLPIVPRDLLTDNFAAYFDYLHGDSPRPVSSLADTRPFVEFYDLAYVAAQRITQVADEHLTHSSSADGQRDYVAIQNIRAACDAFLATGRFPSEQGMPWAKPGGSATLAERERLESIVQAMAATA